MRIEVFSGGDELQAKLQEMIVKAGRAGTLRVGFLEGAEYPDGTSVPMVAAIHEFGAPAAGIPPRPFFRNMVALKSPGWGKALGEISKATAYNMPETLVIMGKAIQEQLQASIRQFDSVPLAPATIKKKGFSSQLIDTSVMLSKVDFQVTTE